MRGCVVVVSRARRRVALSAWLRVGVHAGEGEGGGGDGGGLRGRTALRRHRSASSSRCRRVVNTSRRRRGRKREGRRGRVVDRRLSSRQSSCCRCVQGWEGGGWGRGRLVVTSSRYGEPGRETGREETLTGRRPSAAVALSPCAGEGDGDGEARRRERGGTPIRDEDGSWPRCPRSTQRQHVWGM